MEKMKCVAPGCNRHLDEKTAWLPSVAAMRQANGGRTPEVADFGKFALCGRHGHLLREEGVKVFRFEPTVKRERDRELTWKPFASRFKKGQ